MAALAPMPSANVTTTVIVSPLTFVKDRSANRKSVRRLISGVDDTKQLPFYVVCTLSLARHRQKQTFCLGGVAIASTSIHRLLFQAELRFDRRPVPLQVDECLEAWTSEKGVGRALQADRGTRARTVIVSGPDGGRVWQALEH